MREVRCKVCEMGTLRQREIYRNNRRLVDIGHVLLAPSIPSVVICAVAYVSLPSGGAEITSNGGPESIFLFVGLAALVCGIMGWALVMKKTVQICNVCRSLVEPNGTIRKADAGSASLSR
jgi:hypothetical protein